MIACSCPVCTSSDDRDKRLRSSILVQSAATTVAVDAGPDFRAQMLRTGIKKLDGILFTHSHKDHIAGLDDVRGFNYFSEQPMDIYGSEMTFEIIIREFSYAFAEKKYPGAPEIRLNTITTTPFIIGDLLIQPILVWHLHMPVFGYRFGRFTYITDANRIEEDSRAKIRGSDILVLNALRKEKHISHFTLGEAMEMVNELEVPQAYFTHISHQLGRHADISKELPPGIHLAYDQLQLHLPGII